MARRFANADLPANAVPLPFCQSAAMIFFNVCRGPLFGLGLLQEIARQTGELKMGGTGPADEANGMEDRGGL